MARSLSVASFARLAAAAASSARRSAGPATTPLSAARAGAVTSNPVRIKNGESNVTIAPVNGLCLKSGPYYFNMVPPLRYAKNTEPIAPCDGQALTFRSGRMGPTTVTII